MASLAPRLGAAVPKLHVKKYSLQALRARRFGSSISVPKAALEVAQLADSLVSADVANAVSTLPIREASDFLLKHPIASFSAAVAALVIIPKLIEAFVRYLAAPVAIALLAFYVLEFPEESATMITTFLDWVNANPEITSALVIGLALFGLAPAVLTALGATVLVYGLLSVSFGTQLPEVREMQGTFGETLSKVQFFSSVAAKRIELLLK